MTSDHDKNLSYAPLHAKPGNHGIVAITFSLLGWTTILAYILAVEFRIIVDTPHSFALLMPILSFTGAFFGTMIGTIVFLNGQYKMLSRINTLLCVIAMILGIAQFVTALIVLK